MSPLVTTVLRAVVFPAALTALGLATGLARAGAPRARLQALFVALMFLLGSYLLLGRLTVPPADVGEILAFLGLGAALFVAIAPKRPAARYGLRAVFVLLAVLALLSPIRASITGEAWRNVAALGLLTLGLWSIVERTAASVTFPALVAMPVISATALSVLLLFHGSAAISQQIAILCGQFGAFFVFAVFKPGRVSREALTPFLSAMVATFMLVGHFYLDMNPWFMLILCWPFALLWVRPYLPVPRAWPLETAILGVLAAAPLGYFVYQQFLAAGPLY